MNAQDLVKEYQYLDVKHRQRFLADVTKIESIKNLQFNAAKEALKELQRGEFTTFHNATELIDNI